MRLRFAGDDRLLLGKTALDCLRYHCHGDHSAEARRGDIDGVMCRLAATFELETSFTILPTMEARAAAFVKIALEHDLLVGMRADDPQSHLKRFNIDFVGRVQGVPGNRRRRHTTRSAEDPESALLALYDEYEDISHVVVTDIETGETSRPSLVESRQVEL